MDGRAAWSDAGAWLRQPVQAWLDRRVRESTAVREALRELEGRCFAVLLDGPGLRIVLAVNDGRLELAGPAARAADATLTASPLDALTLARSHSLTGLKQTGARLEGNIHVAEQFARVLELVSPEPEAELAGWVGDIAAHEIANATAAAADFFRRAAQSLADDAAEFVQEEQPLLARRDEVDEFVEAVDDLRDAVDRAASRLAALETGAARSGR